MTALVDDALLPAAPYLTSEAAADVIAPAIGATGAALVACAPVAVQYRPGSDLVVRYRVETADRDGQRRRATVMAGTTVAGPPPGTLHVEGDGLTVGVWQWPFDPSLPGLERAVTPDQAVSLVGECLGGMPTLEVVVYRPTERAVVRASTHDGRRVYIKVVPPAIADGLVRRHDLLLAAGLPVPEVVAADPAAGLIVLADLAGPTLRDLLKASAAAEQLPDPDDFIDLRRRLAAVALDELPHKASRTADASAHARMLAEVLPDERERLTRIADGAAAVAERSPAGTAVIHGDLHEAQVIVHDGRIVGLLDVDDVAPGAALDDLATVLAHLRYRAATAEPDQAGAIADYADRLRAGFAPAAGPEADALDAATAAVLVGLATGPFRIQMTAWPAVTADVLDVAERLMREVSERPHPLATTARHADDAVRSTDTATI